MGFLDFGLGASGSVLGITLEQEFKVVNALVAFETALKYIFGGNQGLLDAKSGIMRYWWIGRDLPGSRSCGGSGVELIVFIGICGSFIVGK
ncbi:hypothetical protein V6N12_024599 [Hibiscus sabdariffa]|uniref:Uncharacterized protein n=1 Tax=Hibiscus sabdariffa TaxID=183260 RepID=A0ABR2G1Q6_9ROSI